MYRVSLFLPLLALMLTAPPALSQTCPGSQDLFDGDGDRWDIDCGGSVVDGGNPDLGRFDSYDGYARLSLSSDGVNYIGFYSDDRTVELGGRAFVSGTETYLGLNVTRTVYVPTDASWARFIDAFENPTANPIAVRIAYGGNLGSDGFTVLVASSSGDTAFDASDRWLVTDDDPTSIDLGLAHNFFGAGAALSPTVAEFIPGNPDLFVYYDVVLPPGAAIGLMAFEAQEPTAAEAVAQAQALDALPQGTLAGIPTEAYPLIVNWNLTGTPPPVEGLTLNVTSPEGPVVLVPETRSRQVFEGDVTNASEEAQMADVWAVATLEDGRTFVASGPLSATLQPSETRRFRLRQTIPGATEARQFGYTVYVGDFGAGDPASGDGATDSETFLIQQGGPVSASKAGVPVRLTESDAAWVVAETTLRADRLTLSPNPAARTSTISVHLGVASEVRVAVYDALGREVLASPARTLSAGDQRVALDVSTLPAGAYVVRVVTGDRVQTARLTVSR